MALEIKEYLNFDISESKDFDNINKNLDLTEKLVNKRNTNIISEKSLMVDIEGIHVGPTRNYTWYTSKALASSVESWTSPYNAPLILFHNEKDGKIIGRVLNTEYTSKNTRSGTPALTFTCNIADKDSIESVEDGRLQTVSIGVMAKDVTCSICNAQLAAGEDCEHERGVKYGEKTCYWVINEMEAKELSYVIVPSDPYAHNVSIYKPNGSIKKEITEDSKNDNYLKEDSKVANKKSELKDVELKEEKEIKIEKSISVEEYEEIKNKNISLMEELEMFKSELESEKSMRESTETQMIELNKQLKEMFVEKVLSLREKLKRPELSKDFFESRSMESLNDTITELKEEINLISSNSLEIKEEKTEEKTEVLELKEQESKSDVKEELDVDTITEVKNTSIINKESDQASNKLERDEKKSGLNVKEEEIDSNILKEEEFNSVVNFYNL